MGRGSGDYLHRRWDVLVEAEEVGRVVLVLQRNQPIVVGVIGGPHPLLALHTEIIDIDRRWRERLQRVPKFSRPGDVALGLCWVGPHRGDQEVVVQLSVREGARLRSDATHGPTEMLQYRYGLRRGHHREMRDEGVDGLVAELGQEG